MCSSQLISELELVFVFGVYGIIDLVCVCCVFLKPKWVLVTGVQYLDNNFLLFRDIVGIYHRRGYKFLINIGYSRKELKMHG